jgi:uncharacterized protein (DUF362 family)
MRANGRKAESPKRQPVAERQASAMPSAGRRKRGELVKVTITQQLGAKPLELLEKALAFGDFWKHIERVRRATGLRRDRFRIIIKPDLDFYDSQKIGGTDPALVEHLIDLLNDRGFRLILIGDGHNEPDAWLHNRDPLIVPELAGYRFVTAKGRSYDIVDLHGELKAPNASFSRSSIPISKHWSEADFRINFAKNKTHEEHAYALCAHNLAGLTVTKDTVNTVGRRIAAEVCLQVLRKAPPHFNIIDAFHSCHGGAGHRAPTQIQTHVFVASENALLADWVGAAKMGVDPHASPVNRAALKHIGLPTRYEICGDLSQYPFWRNVHPLILHSAQLRNRADGLGQISTSWFQSVDREHFPFKDFYNDRINSFIAPLMAQLDENPRSFLAVVCLNYAIAKIASVILAQYTMYSKNRLLWRDAPLTIDPHAYELGKYEEIPGYLEPFMQLLQGSPANRNGLRWRHIDGSVLFSCSHVLPIPYDKFVRAVDIASTIQYMNDYIGGSTVAVRRDGRRRVTHQAERNLYLQQPNWMVLFGGEMIDVEKLEFIEYKRNRQSIYWRTVGSPNGSASHDDGCVTFLRSGVGQTNVQIFARQQFALPLFFKFFDINMAPGIRDPIIESGYTNFFAGTIANLQARYDGRSYRIGNDANQTGTRDGSQVGEFARYFATAAAAVAELLRHRQDWFSNGGWLFRAGSGGNADRGRKDVDRHGFRHFSHSPGLRTGGPNRSDEATVAGLAALMRDLPDFAMGLADAVSKDLDRVANGTGERADR